MNDSRRSIALKSTAVLFATVVGGWFFSALKTDLFLSFQYIYYICFIFIFVYYMYFIYIVFLYIYIHVGRQLGDFGSMNKSSKNFELSCMTT